MQMFIEATARRGIRLAAIGECLCAEVAAKALDKIKEHCEA
jgi:hypothetical protein